MLEHIYTQAYTHKHTYTQNTRLVSSMPLLDCIAGKFGGEFNLAVWRLVRAPPNFTFAKILLDVSSPLNEHK